MRRAIVQFDQDDAAHWVALLECGHRQHVRHRPPWQERAWVLTVQGRQGRVGSPLECPMCDEEAARDEVAGGDPACWAHQVCPECGAVADPCAHRPGCPAVVTGDGPPAP